VGGILWRLQSDEEAAQVIGDEVGVGLAGEVATARHLGPL
jgi:hypothetical protein